MSKLKKLPGMDTDAEIEQEHQRRDAELDHLKESAKTREGLIEALTLSPEEQAAVVTLTRMKHRWYDALSISLVEFMHREDVAVDVQLHLGQEIAEFIDTLYGEAVSSFTLSDIPGAFAMLDERKEQFDAVLKRGVPSEIRTLAAMMAGIVDDDYPDGFDPSTLFSED